MLGKPFWGRLLGVNPILNNLVISRMILPGFVISFNHLALLSTFQLFCARFELCLSTLPIELLICASFNFSICLTILIDRLMKQSLPLALF